ncbi:5-bromo-4-chloroindolyl phosphate hydrolysis family protein [Acetobacterium bakii]|uniref:5-bromo-4-chloroindolyl phosphate hydrolysis family protein n=1 Tax=Acetobacterium bakii TaxID=52689 RepID=UPI000681AAB8|nr:5-bromo-4-chloroindolyl phosphate hydrolysis family protein [Acetobacterium bakii]
MAKKDYSNIGDDIKSIIQDALNSTDFKQLNKNITGTVNRALEEVRKESKNWQQQAEDKKNAYNEAVYRKQESNEKNKKEFKNKQKYQEKFIGKPIRKPAKVLVTKAPKGQVSGILLMVFGSIGMVITFIFFMLLVFLSNYSYESLPLLMGSFLPILLINVFMVAKGSGLRARVVRFNYYVKRLGDRTFCEIKDLADATGRSSKFVVKDLRKMIQLGMFPEGRIDEKETYLLISDEAYEAHLKLVERKKLNEELEKDRIEIAQRQRMMEEQNPGQKAAREVIEEGKVTIQKIKDANEAISGEGVSNKLDRLEKVLCKIFEFIEANPEEVPEIRKFMGYYLPTTLKLVGVYQDLDSENFQGANILATKKEIEETLDTINHAFENLLDSFYEDTALDISTDISVLNTILKQEGLAKKDFK